MTTQTIVVAIPLVSVVEAYRLDRYDNSDVFRRLRFQHVVEAYRLDRYDNPHTEALQEFQHSCRSLSFG